jgi:Rrf2 family protein
MILSRASKYAILATLYLAINSSKDKKVSVKSITKNIEVPSPFLAKLLQQLVRSKLISSTKGPNGGFYLTKVDSHKSVFDIIAVIDGVDKFDECFLGLNKCDAKHPCPVHYLVEPFKDKILSEFKDKTILEFAQEIVKNKRVLTLKGLDID